MEAAAAFSRSVKVSLPTAKVLVRLQNPLAAVRLPCSWLLSTLRGSRRRPNRAVAGFSAPAVTVQAQICSRSARHVVTTAVAYGRKLLRAPGPLPAAPGAGAAVGSLQQRREGCAVGGQVGGSAAAAAATAALSPPHCTAAWLPACI